jgi:hypothetical protein
MPGESVNLTAGATGRSFPLGPVLHFVDPRAARADDGGAHKADRLADALKRQPGETGESLMSRTTQTMRDILQAADLSDADKGNLLSQAIDTLMGAGMTFKQETEALITRAKSERDRLDALLATVRPGS